MSLSQGEISGLFLSSHSLSALSLSYPDEAHKAKNAGNKRTSSKTGNLVTDLQTNCRNARVVYVSATPASKPDELSYMQRCGYWGTGLAWDSFSNFEKALEKRGMAAMEIFATEMV